MQLPVVISNDFGRILYSFRDIDA